MWRMVPPPLADVPLADVLLQQGVEADEPVRAHAGLDEPDPVVRIDGDAVGARALAARVGPLPDLAGPRVHAAQVSARIVHIPDDVARVDHQPPGPGAFGKLVVGGLEGLRIDHDQPVGPEEGRPGAVASSPS